MTTRLCAHVSAQAAAPVLFKRPLYAWSRTSTCPHEPIMVALAARRSGRAMPGAAVALVLALSALPRVVGAAEAALPKCPYPCGDNTDLFCPRKDHVPGGNFVNGSIAAGLGPEDGWDVRIYQVEPTKTKVTLPTFKVRGPSACAGWAVWSGLRRAARSPWPAERGGARSAALRAWAGTVAVLHTRGAGVCGVGVRARCCARRIRVCVLPPTRFGGVCEKRPCRRTRRTSVHTARLSVCTLVNCACCWTARARAQPAPSVVMHMRA